LTEKKKKLSFKRAPIADQDATAKEPPKADPKRKPKGKGKGKDRPASGRGGAEGEVDQPPAAGA
jgi:hypothetical protein